MRRHLPACLLLAALATTALAARPPSTEWKEVVPPDEPARFQEYLADIRTMQDRNAADSDGVIRRGFHAKAHAGVRARLTVLDDLPEPARQGLFAQPGSYEATARLSNGLGTIGPDWAPDVRGFALKVAGVPGPTLMEDPEQGVVQDLIMINHPYLPIRDIEQLMGLVRVLNEGEWVAWRLARVLGISGLAKATKFVASRLRTKTRSLLTEDYYSTIPVKWGPYAAKVRLRPHAEGAPKPPKKVPDYLRADLTQRLAAGPARFDVMVQFYTDERDTPIEDGSIDWDEDVSPWVKVGLLELPQQDLTSPEGAATTQAAQDMAFNPWHSHPEHRPLGSLMRARQAVYKASAAYRKGQASAD